MVKQTPEQLAASDPKSSVWVGASAGTGKTFVLSNRVLRLMLAGSRPDKILCLTYTNTAAAEMAIRVNGQLSKWISMADNDLYGELRDILGSPPTEDQMIMARKLFARVLDVPGGLKIQTIHSFCQSLLGRFPIEANISPNFDLLDDITINEQLKFSQDEMLQQIEGGNNEKLADTLNYLSGMMAEDTFATLMKSLTNERAGLEELLRRNSSSFRQVETSLKELLEFSNQESRETILQDACKAGHFDELGLYSAAKTLMKGSATDIARGESVAKWIKDEANRVNGFYDYCAEFLTKSGEIRARLMTKKLSDQCPHDLDALMKEAERLNFVSERLKAFTLFENTSAILRMGYALIKTYNARKRGRNVVDYDDLISKVAGLFKNVSASWILYKLDEGIDHILIDEAQDTNPEQWDIIRKLALEFFSGIGTRDEDEYKEYPRTIFAVGDVKQSIYSFQKAEPKQFNLTRDYFKKQVSEANLNFNNVPMNLSFRSTSAILEVVDHVFRSDAYRFEISFDYQEISHSTHRVDEPGLVEIWDPILPEEKKEDENWSPPVIQKPAHDPKQKLADKIADKIATWLESGEILASKGRPVTAGDILILVQKRKEFVHFMIRALKKRKINVAGLDQMVLTDQLAVMDLIAVANFTLLPSDDLTLATVLKSPFIGMDENDLFELAYPRGKGESLWSALLKRQSEKTSFSNAADFLKKLTNYADFYPPFEFFSYLLGPLRGREKLIARLGEQSNDPVDEFLNQAMKYEQNNISSMQGFLSWIEKGEIKIKRDMEQGGDMVRIMTVHGAKGLQAPIVFLPDTCQATDLKDTLFWYEQKYSKNMLWVKNAETRVGAGKIAYDARKADVEAENKRLLYVAMTRAEDRLYVTGWENDHHTNRKDNCWYDLIRNAVHDMDGTEEIRQGDEIILRREHKKETPKISSVKHMDEKGEISELPSWAFAITMAEPVPRRPLSPSKPDDKEETISSPLRSAEAMKRDKKHYHRGRLIHKLLEILPQLPDMERADAATRYLSQKALDLPNDDIGQIADEVISILQNKDFKVLFGENSRSEVPIVGQIGSFSLSGQVDRLAVTEDEIYIIDYKTNRPPPQSAENIPMIYQRQMAAYRAVLNNVYPEHHVRSFLLWTDIGRLMEIPEAQLNKIEF
ncbi:MAG TPA: double-strand break repair helicase AddA [Emcibacteraceae bacterium]|nr:double-strand break repair helicase AddA [Emcibacteraceae bacterium]